MQLVLDSLENLYSIFLFFDLLKLHFWYLLVHQVVKGQEFVDDFLVFEFQHYLHELSQLNVVHIRICLIKQQRQVCIPFHQLFNPQLFRPFLLSRPKQKPSLKLGISLLTPFSLWLRFLLRTPFLLVLVTVLFNCFLSLLTARKFLVVNVLSFICYQCDPMFSPVLFDLFNLFISLWVNHLNIPWVLRPTSLTFLLPWHFFSITNSYWLFLLIINLNSSEIDRNQ